MSKQHISLTSSQSIHEDNSEERDYDTLIEMATTKQQIRDIWVELRNAGDNGTRFLPQVQRKIGELSQ